MHANDTIKTSDTVLRKIYFSLYWVVCERELETKQNCNILTPTLLAITAFLSCSPGLLNRRPGGPAFLEHVPQSSIFSPTRLIPNSQSGAWGLPLLGAGFHNRILSPTNWLPVLTEDYKSSTLTFLWTSQSHSFNPSMVKVIFWYSLSGCIGYLHRCISYFDSPAGS